jgi:prolyl oligopeptidase
MIKQWLCTGFLSACLIIVTAQPKTNALMKYPDTRKDKISDSYFGTKVEDPYRWLEDDLSAETGAWVKAQNKLTQDYLSKIPYRNAIARRYETLFNYEKFSAPSREGAYIYYSRNSGLQNQNVIYREPLGGGKAEVFLDPNSFSKDGTTSLAGLYFSPDGSMCSYHISEGGSDWSKIIVMDAINKKILDDTLNDIKFTGSSWRGNEGFYYSTYERPKDGSFLAGKTNDHHLFYHKIGTPQSEDQRILYTDNKEPVRYVSGYVSENQRWLIVSGANATYGNDLYVLDLTSGESTFKKLVEDMDNSHNVIDVDDQYFYIETDRKAPNKKLVIAPVSNPVEMNWQTLVQESDEVLNASASSGFLFGNYLKDAVSVVRQFDHGGKLVREIELPGLGTASGFSGKHSDKEMYYTYTSYINPPTIFKYDPEKGNSSVYKKPGILFNPAEYESKQVFYTSKDGTQIPMILTYKKGLQQNGKNPCLLYAYGGFSVSITPAFSTSSIIFLENGGVYAVPNIRGGGEYGEAWHEAGTKLKKQNVFDDFYAASRWLIENKYTSTDKLAIKGGSNGGLLIGACITQHPDMCKVAFPMVGVLDMLRYHKFTSGAGWAYDYGTADDNADMFKYLYGYSPVQNAKPASYPATMITTGDHDDRVVPAHSFKFAAALQAAQQGPDPVLIRIETKAGHGAGRSTKQIIAQESDMWAFLFYNMGITPKYKTTP